jgi:Icc-related predicted phosphoesterase
MKHMNTILCAADPRGDVPAVKQLIRTAADSSADAIAIVGDLAEGGARESHRAVFGALAVGGIPTFWVPGAGDAPVADYLREAHDIEQVHLDLHGVHGTAAVAPDGHVLFAGLGGEADDDPDGPRDEMQRLHYPRWEAEYRLRIISQFENPSLVLLFATPPAHKGLQTPGSEALAALAATHRARLVVCGGDRVTEMIGRTLVVGPGSLRDGQFAVVDLRARIAEMRELTVPA